MSKRKFTNERQNMLKLAREIARTKFKDVYGYNSAGNDIILSKYIICSAKEAEQARINLVLEKNPEFDEKEFKKMITEIRQKDKELEESFLY